MALLNHLTGCATYSTAYTVDLRWSAEVHVSFLSFAGRSGTNEPSSSLMCYTGTEHKSSTGMKALLALSSDCAFLRHTLSRNTLRFTGLLTDLIPSTNVQGSTCITPLKLRVNTICLCEKMVLSGNRGRWEGGGGVAIARNARPSTRG